MAVPPSVPRHGLYPCIAPDDEWPGSYGYLDIAASIIWGLRQYLLAWLYTISRLLKPERVWFFAPWWWYLFGYGWSDFEDNFVTGRQPGVTWCQFWLIANWGLLWRRVEYDLLVARATVAEHIWAARISISQVSLPIVGWFGFLVGLLGLELPSWATDVVGGLTKLWKWLPFNIRHSLTSWGQLFYDLRHRVMDWVEETYNDAVAWASDAITWITSAGDVLWRWRQTVSSWIAEFMDDPVGTIRGWLGERLDQLMLFAQFALGFWFQMWSLYAEKIGAFFYDPLMWIYDRVEDELVRRW